MPNDIEIVAILPKVFDANGLSIPPQGGRPPGCALVRIQRNSTWALLESEGRGWFVEQFKAGSGPISGWVNLEANSGGKLVFEIDQYYPPWGSNPHAKGVVVVARRGDYCSKYTHYWRVLDVARLSDDEKMAEVTRLQADEMWPVVGAKFVSMFTFWNAVWMIILGALFASGVAEAIIVGTLLLVGLSIPILDDDLRKFAVYSASFKQLVNSATTEDDLREAARVGAEFWVAVIEFVLTACADYRAVRHCPSLSEARQARQQAREQVQGAYGVYRRKGPAAAREKMAQVRPRKFSLREGEEVYKEWADRSKAAYDHSQRLKRQGRLDLANSELLVGFEAAVEAELSYRQLRMMKGHAMVIESVSEWAGVHVYADLKSDAPGRIVSKFDHEKIPAKLEEANAVAQYVPYLKGFKTSGHDWTFDWDKQKARINEGMKYQVDIKKVTISKELQEALRSGDITVFERECAKDPTLDKYWKTAQYDAMRRILSLKESMTEHTSNSPHHAQASSILEVLESKWDLLHAKIMSERGYQATQTLDNIKFFDDDSPRDKGLGKLAWYSFKMYLEKGGPYSREQIIRCSQLATDIKRVH